MDLDNYIHDFFRLVSGDRVEIYNEFSLQHELGAYLRSVLSREEWKVQFERPVQFFGIEAGDLPKKEIDVAVFTRDLSKKTAVELKFPRNGQYPDQMFSACRDIAFLEGMVKAGFQSGFFVFAADDRLFFEGADGGGLYSCFRAGNPLCGMWKNRRARRMNG